MDFNLRSEIEFCRSQVKKYTRLYERLLLLAFKKNKPNIKNNKVPLDKLIDKMEREAKSKNVPTEPAEVVMDESDSEESTNELVESTLKLINHYYSQNQDNLLSIDIKKPSLDNVFETIHR